MVTRLEVIRFELMFDKVRLVISNLVQAALVIRGLFTCEFVYSHWKKWSKMTIFQSKIDFLSANSRFAVQNDGTYLPRITRDNCTPLKSSKIISNLVPSNLVPNK